VSLRIARRVERDRIDKRGRVQPIVDVEVAGRSFSDRSAPFVAAQRF
jgi:hypothetical protein